jgi:site-specific DNA-methyltransferase (adenine-specific)
MATLDAETVDSIVTDPPYGLSFMGRDWDHGVPGEAFWREALRVAKPGAHLLAFGGSRTYHRLACAIEDAGWEIRDCIMWVYGSGFPKSHDVSKAIDREAGAEREVVESYQVTRDMSGGSWADLHGKPNHAKMHDITAPATDAAKQWQGWGTALKPAYEPIIVARKPLVGTVAANVQQYGTGAINVDGCRVNPGERIPGGGNGKASNGGRFGAHETNGTRAIVESHTLGRWPANFIHDGSDEVIAGLGESARFFYCAKAGKRDRDEGLDMFDVVRTGGMQATADGSMLTGSGNERTTARANHHPTVKPTDLMRYLCRLATPPSGTVLDPFMGSGSTGKGATLEGFDFIGIEQNTEYLEIAKARIQHAIDSASEKLFSDSV